MGGDYIAYCRTRDEEWREIPRRNGCLDMAYKDNILYMCNFNGRIRVLGFDDSGSFGDGEKWEKVYSFGEEEALVWDLNVTLPTKGVTGIQKDSIYFCHTYKFRREVAACAMTTQSLHPFGPPDLGLGDARWFIPSFSSAER
ncbi:unnamed protein product [Arabis nemorensis]|uniref:KIB1-4 beta-propeller domain-containing protein n=1 Tax=Arabis nemorensis TaxID=586526 RepID=A0A565CSE9_9BRAS|nr:unnamed protein product [Arabis nemorensis]